MTVSRRNIFLINRGFQFRFSAYVFGWVMAVSFVYPLIIYSLFSFFANYLRLDPNGPDLQAIELRRTQVLWLLIAFQAAIFVLTFLVSLFMSHRIAGPIYKLTQFLRQGAQGNFKGDMTFREKDYFPELAEDYNLMVQRVHQELDRRNQAIRDAITELEKDSKATALAKLKQTL